jgi:hypothetical protein
MMTTVSAEVVASGSFADNATVNADKCTWTYSLDSNGTLTIGGTGTGTTDLNYNKGYNDLANNGYSQIPWKNSGKIVWKQQLFLCSFHSYFSLVELYFILPPVNGGSKGAWFFFGITLRILIFNILGLINRGGLCL